MNSGRPLLGSAWQGRKSDYTYKLGWVGVLPDVPATSDVAEETAIALAIGKLATRSEQ